MQTPQGHKKLTQIFSRKRPLPTSAFCHFVLLLAACNRGPAPLPPPGLPADGWIRAVAPILCAGAEGEDGLADFAIADPEILLVGGRYHLWFSSYAYGGDGQSLAFGISHAESADGIHWIPPPGNPVPGLRNTANAGTPILRRENPPSTLPDSDRITGMAAESTRDIVIRFSLPFKIAALLVTGASLVVYVPLALQAVPREALGPLVFFLAVPALFIYASFFALTFQLRVGEDGITAEAVPNPLVRSFRCRYADISGIEKDVWWSTLLIYRFKQPEPFRIPHLEILEGSPAALLEEIRSHLPADAFVERTTVFLRRGWKWHRLLAGILVLLAAVGICLLLLDGGGAITVEPDAHAYAYAALAAGLAFFGSLDWITYRMINSET
jgi:hypothetical protein